MHLQFTIYNLQFTNHKLFSPTKKKSWVIHMHLQFTIYNLQIIFADLKKIMGDTYAFTIYNLQIIFANLKINVDDT